MGGDDDRVPPERIALLAQERGKVACLDGRRCPRPGTPLRNQADLPRDTARDEVSRGGAREAVSSVAAVIPSWNTARYLERCLDSVAQQAGVSVETMVVDN